MVFYTLVLQFYLKMGKRKKKMIPFWVREQEEERDICRWKRDSFSSEVEITTNRLNKAEKKEDFKKYLMNLIETNHHINMTSDHSVQAITYLKAFRMPRVSKCF